MEDYRGERTGILGDVRLPLSSRPRHPGALVTLKWSYYENGNTALVATLAESIPEESAHAGETWARISVNVNPLPWGNFIPHHDLSPADLKALLDSKLVEDTGERVAYGFVEGAPVLRIVG